MQASGYMENSDEPDSEAGFPVDSIPDGEMNLGQADGEDVAWCAVAMN
jgi:hypothetical protein